MPSLIAASTTPNADATASSASPSAFLCCRSLPLLSLPSICEDLLYCYHTIASSLLSITPTVALIFFLFFPLPQSHLCRNHLCHNRLCCSHALLYLSHVLLYCSHRLCNNHRLCRSRALHCNSPALLCCSCCLCHYRLYHSRCYRPLLVEPNAPVVAPA
ncbi:hypothetical protein BHM03_00004337 [Ensete ventricosum]|nr:hypothetical protein BHM03_00004337 [Ensete ventricosum]